MIRYYAYYNYGGYKDLFLGSNEDVSEYRYFLPLLSVYEKDDSMKDKVQEWKFLPRIVNLSNETIELNYPSDARVLFSHAGYKLQYRRFGSKDVLAIRDIDGEKDYYGRSCPFAVMAVADTETDKTKLKSVAFHSWKHMKETESFLKSLFANDQEVNGLRFGIHRLNERLNAIVLSNEGTLEENRYNRKTAFFIFPDGIKYINAFEEQSLKPEDVSLAYNVSCSNKYRYKPSDDDSVSHGGGNNENENRNEEHEQQHFSIRTTLGLSKEEDFKVLLESHRKLCEKVEQLVKRVEQLEHR